MQTPGPEPSPAPAAWRRWHLPARFSLQVQLRHCLVVLIGGDANTLGGEIGHIASARCPPQTPHPAWPRCMGGSASAPHPSSGAQPGAAGSHRGLTSCSRWDAKGQQGTATIPTVSSHLLLPGWGGVPKDGLTVGADGLLADRCGQRRGGKAVSGARCSQDCQTGRGTPLPPPPPSPPQRTPTSRASGTTEMPAQTRVGPTWSLSEAGAGGKAGSAGVPLTPPSLGTLGGPHCAPLPGGLSPGLPVGLCGMGGKPPLGQPGLLENRRGKTGEGLAWLRPGWGGSLQGFFHLLFLPGLHGLEAAPERG